MAADPLSLECDEARFERLYREYAGDVYRYALAIMRNPSDAEDVTQATFLNAWRAFSAGEEPRAPLNWFISIAHNVCRLRFRTNSRRPREVEFEPALAEAPAREGPGAADVLEALAELPLNQRAALVMRELEGRSYGEIASILGVSRAAVETLIFRARRSLRVRRDAVRTLALLPLPQSLASFVRTRGAAETGAALLGSGIAAKAVAVIAAGVVAAGVARDTVRADPQPAARPTAPSAVRATAQPVAPQAFVAAQRAEKARLTHAQPQAKTRAQGPATVVSAPAGAVTRARRGRPATVDDGTVAAAPARPLPTPLRPQPRTAPPSPDVTTPAPDPAPAAQPPAPTSLPALPKPKLPTVPTPEVPAPPAVAPPALPAVPPPPAVPALPEVEVPPVTVPELPALPPDPLP